MSDKQLQAKILSGGTELQVVFEGYEYRLNSLVNERVRILNRLGDIDDEILSSRAGLEKCRRRAAEQGYPNLFDK